MSSWFSHNKNSDKKSGNATTMAGLLVVAFVLMVSIAALSIFFSRMQKPVHGTDSGSSKIYDRYYVLISSNDSSLLWRNVAASAAEYGRKTGAYVDLLSRNFSTEYEKTELFDMAVSMGTDGIILEADDSEELQSLMTKASVLGIPVVTAYSDSPGSMRVSFVEVSNFNLGREYGRLISACAGEKADVAVIADTHKGNERDKTIMSGIREALEQTENHGEGVELRSLAIGSRNSFAVEEALRRIFLKEETLPDVFVCPDEHITELIYRMIIDYNRVGEIKLLGYLNSDTILEGIEQKVINASVSVDTEEMGEICVRALDEYIDTGNVSGYFSVDTHVINRSNVDSFRGGH